MGQLLDWLLDSDPSIRWQTLCELTDAPDAQVAAEREKVAQIGWGKALLDLQTDGRWAGGACFPSQNWRPPGPIVGDPDGQPWTATLPTLRLLRDFGIDPADSAVETAVNGVRDHCRWEYANEPFFEGEVEPCINGGTVAIGAYFGQNVDAIVQRLLGEQLADGGWNCEVENGSTRSSFHSTICVLEGLQEYARSEGSLQVHEAQATGQEYLLSRQLLRRASDGEIIDSDWLMFSFPVQWHYDVLRAVDYFRAGGGAPDPRLSEALELVRSRQQPDGRWLLANTHPGLMHFEMETGDGKPSRWNTLRALRVLRWYDAANPEQIVAIG